MKRQEFNEYYVAAEGGEQLVLLPIGFDHRCGYCRGGVPHTWDGHDTAIELCLQSGIEVAEPVLAGLMGSEVV